MSTAGTAAAVHEAAAPPSPARTRIPLLDIARGWAMIGVVLMNATVVAVSAESLGEAPESMAATAANTGAAMLFSGRSRELLMLLLGIGAVLTWRSAIRRGQRPLWLLARRYAVLFVVFGLAHRYFFDGDILTHYALVGLVFIPLLPPLLDGPRWRPLALVAVLVMLSAVVQAAAPPLPFDLRLGVSTLGAFALGAWLARSPRFERGPSVSEAEETGIRRGRLSNPAVRIILPGIVLHVAGGLALAAGSLLFPQRFDAENVPLPPSAGEEAFRSVGSDVLAIGGALLYFGLIWWLVDRGRTAARLLGVLAPIGRMSLTVYLASTAVFLLTMDGRDGELSVLVQLGIALGYFLAMAVLCPLWLRTFRLGPAEWLWRCLSYMRLLPAVRA